MILRSIAALACTTVLAVASLAQDKPSSPPANAMVTLAGKQVIINYHAPSTRGRKIMGGLVPYDQVWRTGANEATTLVTAVSLKIGTLNVPAGTYTIFTLPSQKQWLLIVSKKTGEWGIPYPEGDDLGRTPMMSKSLATPQEVMSITFENNKSNSAELHVRWENTDEYVTVTAQ
jgi:hypothetical protein